jgi:hypothetical protein
MSCHWLAAMPAAASGMSSSNALRITWLASRVAGRRAGRALPWTSRGGGHFGDHVLPPAAVLTREGPVQLRHGGLGRWPGWAGFPDRAWCEWLQKIPASGIRRGCRRRIRSSFRPGVPCDGGRGVPGRAAGAGPRDQQLRALRPVKAVVSCSWAPRLAPAGEDHRGPPGTCRRGTLPVHRQCDRLGPSRPATCSWISAAESAASAS